MSTLDENGILLYDEADARDTFSALMNMGQESVSDAMSADRGRLAVLEAKDALGVVTASCTASSGWSISVNTARKKNGMVFWRLRFTRTGSAISVPSDGNITNQRVATFNPGWQPAVGMTYLASSGDIGPLAAGALYATDDIWELYLTSVSAGSSIPTGTEFTLTGVFPLA